MKIFKKGIMILLLSLFIGASSFTIAANDLNDVVSDTVFDASGIVLTQDEARNITEEQLIEKINPTAKSLKTDEDLTLTYSLDKKAAFQIKDINNTTTDGDIFRVFLTANRDSNTLNLYPIFVVVLGDSIHQEGDSYYKFKDINISYNEYDQKMRGDYFTDGLIMNWGNIDVAYEIHKYEMVYQMRLITDIDEGSFRNVNFQGASISSKIKIGYSYFAGAPNSEVWIGNYESTINIEIAAEDTLSITGLPKNIKVGDSFTLTPNIDTITSDNWEYDKTYFEATFNSPATFTAKKAGSTQITVTSRSGQKSTFEIKINSKQPGPNTGDHTNKNSLIAMIFSSGILFLIILKRNSKLPIK